MREEDKMRRLNELEKCWQRYNEHSRQVKEEEEAQRAWDMQEREKRIRKREKFLQVLKKRDEELQEKLHEENHQQAEQLKEQADYLEKRKQMVVENEVLKWKKGFQRKQENWSNVVSQHREAMKKRQEKHLEELFDRNHLPSVTTRCTRNFRKFGGSSRPGTMEKSYPPQSTTVRFTTKPRVHFVEASLPNESAMKDGGVRQSRGDNQIISKQEETRPLEGGGGADTSKRGNTADLDHNDSYDIHLERSRKWSKTDSDGIQQSDLSPVLDKNGCAGSKTSLVRDDVSLLSHDVSLLSQQKSTASDLIGRVLDKATVKVADR
ncbi:uncharacterized protein LOC135332892 isoform X1 [Halichondria panicea]|uniref:uncharacterized protein LOC135332892 isoform X1 n=2 Tax=Halichondria panicea TaxID=6063 RepID=UPI00312BB744